MTQAMWPRWLRPEPQPLQQATAGPYLCRRLKHGFDSVSMGPLGPGVHKVLFELSKNLWQVWGLILNMTAPLLPSCWGLSFALGHGVSFLGGIQHSLVNGFSAVSCNFGVLTGEDEYMSSTLPSCQDASCHLTCLLRNLYACQEATVRTGHGTTDGFQIGKGVHQGYILSPCLFNLYAEYILWNARVDEAQSGIKIARRNINNLRHTDDTTLMTEGEDELKNLSMKVKEKNKKLKTQHSKNENSGIWSQFFMANRWGNNKNSDRICFLGFQNYCRWRLQPWS